MRRSQAATLALVSTLGLSLGAGVPLAAMGAVKPAPLPPSHVQNPPESRWSVNGTVFAIAQTPRRVYLGGNFSSVTRNSDGLTLRRVDLAAFDRATGALVRTWRPESDGVVRALGAFPAGDKLYVGGSFTALNGAPESNVAAVRLSDGSTEPAWQGATDRIVRDVLVHRKRVYLAGAFTTVDGAPARSLTALRRGGGSLVPGWDAQVGGGLVETLTTAPGGVDLVAGGTFSSLGGSPRENLGSVALADGAVTSWAPQSPCTRCFVVDVAASDSTVFTGLAGPGGTVQAFRSGAVTPAWTRHADGDVQVVHYSDHRLFAGGHFLKVAGEQRSQMVEMRQGDGRLTGFSPRFDTPSHPGVWAIRAGRDGLRVGGGFSGIQGHSYSGFCIFGLL